MHLGTYWALAYIEILKKAATRSRRNVKSCHCRPDVVNAVNNVIKFKRRLVRSVTIQLHRAFDGIDLILSWLEVVKVRLVVPRGSRTRKGVTPKGFFDRTLTQTLENQSWSVTKSCIISFVIREMGSLFHSFG